jgi:hypothetical protein
VGEIGFPRKEFLRELRWWEVRSIIRGYNARYHHGWEQARLVAYNAYYCMGSKDVPPTVSKWLPFPWETERMFSAPTDDDIRDLQADLAAMRKMAV